MIFYLILAPSLPLWNPPNARRVTICGIPQGLAPSRQLSGGKVRIPHLRGCEKIRNQVTLYLNLLGVTA